MSSDEESSQEQLSPTKDALEEHNDSDVAIAVPPIDNYGNEIASSGTSALDILEQVSSEQC